MFILVFIIILALLVLVHELGHFIMAKKAGMQVEEFGFGFGPRLVGFQRGETLYSINLLPLGGFVRILGENNEGEDNPRSFINRGFFSRFGTLIAGVFMNMILAWVLLSIAFMAGVPSEISPGQPLPHGAVITDKGIAITQIQPGTPADKAGLAEGDMVLAVDGRSFDDIQAMAQYVKAQAGHNITFAIRRGEQNVNISAYVRPNPPQGQGALGVAFDSIGKIHLPWYIAPWYGLKSTWLMFTSTISGFYHIIAAGQGLQALGGPVKIAALTNQVTKLGLIYIVNFAAILSVNLAIINVLPIPALDGGRILFLIVEAVRGKRNNQIAEQWANAFGFGLLMLLIVFISIRDIRSLIGK